MLSESARRTLRQRALRVTANPCRDKADDCT